MVAVVTGNAYLGLLGGAAAGVLANLGFAWFVIVARTNQLATGFALYFLGGAASSLIGSQYIGSSTSGIGTLSIPGLDQLPAPWNQVFRQDLVVWLMVPTALLVWWLLTRTRWGLHVRAVGEDRSAAFSAGLRPSRLQFQALIIAGSLSGLAGAELTVDYTRTWQDWITQGRGFIAICIVMLALWNPFRAVLGAMLFSLAFAIGLQLQASGSSIEPSLLQMMPYLITLLVVLVGARPKRYSSPAGLREVFAGTSK
jgi:general nucleoside transport system permease protein